MNWIFGDNINTDLITPGRYNTTTDAQALAKITFIEHRPEFAKKVKKGDVVIGGKNFGCGSSRETAVTALKFCGVRAIVAQSFARIFYRNCLNLGMYALTANTQGIAESDVLKLDFKKKELINVTKKRQIPFTMPETMQVLHEEGGIIEYIRHHGLHSIEVLFAGK